MAKITDPDTLVITTDVVFDTAAKTVEVLSTGNVSDAGTSATNGVTLQTLYSFAKEQWRSTAALMKFPFPFDPITAEQFEVINGWTFKTGGTETLLRDAGWAVKDTSGNIIEMWANVTTLGNFDASADQAYHQQELDGTAVDFDFAGEVNQAVQIVDDPNGDGNYVDGYDYRAYLKVFLREENKLFKAYDLIAGQSPTNEAGESKMTYRKYGLPLADNGTDLNYVESDANIGTITPYTDIDITYIDGNGFYTTDQTDYLVDDVVKDGATPGRWYICTGAGTTDATDYGDLGAMGGAGTATFSSYTGEREVVTDEFHAYNVIVDGNVNDADANAEKGENYEKVQYSLRQDIDIDEGAGSVIGKTADDLLEFVGTQLVTKAGVFVDDYLATEKNDYTMTDVGGTARNFAYVAGVILNFNDNAQADGGGFKYTLFFTNDDAGDNNGDDYGTSTAKIIDDNGGTDIDGTATATAQVITDFDYDGNLQRGTGSDGEDAPYTAVGLGTDEAQFATVTGTITRTAANTISFVAAKERVYLNP